MEKRYGWWSNQAAANNGYSVYKTPSGDHINVCFVTRDPTNHGTKWPDIHFVGEVTEHVRNMKPVMMVHDEINFEVVKSEPKAPCPLAYNGIGNCTCGKCRVRKRNTNRNPFGY